MGGGAEPLSIVVLCWRHTSLSCLVVTWLSLVTVVFACVCVWLLHVIIGSSSHVVISSSSWVLVTAMPCSWCWVVLRGARLSFVGAGLSFVRVVVHGCCLLGVICRWVGQDEGGKGGAHQCHSINNNE